MPTNDELDIQNLNSRLDHVLNDMDSVLNYLAAEHARLTNWEAHKEKQFEQFTKILEHFSEAEKLGHIGLNPALPLLRVGFPLPLLITPNEFLAFFTEKISSIEYLYSVYAILNLGNEYAKTNLVEILRIENTSSAKQQESFSTIINSFGTPLQIVSVHYGSPISIDLLGIGKIFEIIRDILKDVAWKSEHEKQMAELERKNKIAEIGKTELDIEQKALEVAAQKIENEKKIIEVLTQKVELLEKIRGMRLSKEEKKVIIPALLSAVIPLTNTTAIILSNEGESFSKQK